MPSWSRDACAMSGSRFLLDTNAPVSLLAGDTALAGHLNAAEWVGISIISQIEFLAFSELSADNQMLFTEFLQRMEVVGLPIDDTVLLDEIIRMRRQYRTKVPDAIIAAMAVTMSATLNHGR
jgi:tRNA(fMet)-specific endonuclease VapC